MQLTVNGRETEIADGATLATWLAALGREPRAVAVERNGAIVPRADYASTRLREGDRIEVVQFVQGG